MILVTFFADYRAKTKTEERLTLEVLGERIRTTRAASKELLPWLKFARFGARQNPATVSGSLRWNGNVEEISGVVADYDGESVSIEEAVERLGTAGVEALVYASPRHMLNGHGPRWRVGCPFSALLPPGRHHQMVSRLNGALGGILASESWTLSQSFYFGATDGSPARQVEIITGRHLDCCDDIDEIGKPNGDASARTPGVPEATDDDIKAALDVIPNPLPTWDMKDTWYPWNNIGMAIWRASGGSDAGRDAFKKWAAKWSAKYDEDETNFRWNHYRSSPPARIGFGRLVHLAREVEPGWVEPSRLVIDLTAGKRPEAVARGIAALATADFFRRADKIVYVMRSPAKAADGRTIMIPSIVSVTTPYLQNELGKRAVWRKYDGRKKQMVQVDVPHEIATAIAAMPNDWQFQPVSGVINTQTMRPDGTLLQEPGYDPQTHFVLFDPPSMRDVPESPSFEDAKLALGVVDGLLDEFPFADKASRSVALSLIFSLVLRPALYPAVPLHSTNAPEGGTGKSYIFDVASTIAIGEVSPAISRGSTPEETEKRLIGAALEGRLLLMLDNCNGELRSEFLCQAIERPLIKPRPLGTSAMPTIPNGFVCGVNGNNIEIAEDLVRRTIQCQLDANMEKPYLREFKRDPLREVLLDRGKYIAAVLTVARAYIVADMPNRPKKLLSFSAWSDLVRGSLMWLGRADPVDTVTQVSADDPMRVQRQAVFSAIFNAMNNSFLGESTFSVSDVLKKSKDDDTLRSALTLVAKAKDRDEISPEKLSWWFRRAKGRVVDGYKLLKIASDRPRDQYWAVTKTTTTQAVPPQADDEAPVPSWADDEAPDPPY